MYGELDAERGSACKTPEMAFTVHFTATSRIFDDEHDWKIRKNGVLEISMPDGLRLLYSPSFWFCVEAK